LKNFIYYKSQLINQFQNIKLTINYKQMKFPKLLLGLGIAILLASCGTQKVAQVPQIKYELVTSEGAVAKKGVMTPEQVQAWPHMDIMKDSVPGMSLDKAYEFISGKKGTTVIVAVVDSGIDIEHEDLNDVIWVNEDEIPNNGIDDDKNGYVDDMNGWNFLGGAAGKDVPEQLEMTRIVAKLTPKYEGKIVDQVEDKAEFEKFTELKAKVDEEYKGALGQKVFYNGLKNTLIATDKAIQEKLGKKDYTVDEIMNLELDNPDAAMGKGMLLRVMASGATAQEGIDDIQGAIDYFSGQADYNYNVNFKGRLTNDNPEDIKDVPYGNNLVIGSKDTEIHGTHVSGIILAERNNGVGMNGVTTNAKLMSVRAVPDGDEYDKDVALAIRYAVDNGAKVINMSFGKSYSSQTQWVYDAIKYAESKDVLLVHAAGNDSNNVDVEDNFPTDSKDKITEFAGNVITVGAMTRHFDDGLVARFSNYGVKNVDIFAPGLEIYSTFPKNEYQSIQGTSMASPEVAGVAALIRSYYPSLTAKQVKQILMDSGIEYKGEVTLPSERGAAPSKSQFSTLSVSGKVLNAYNALVLAEQMVNNK
jgi:subtilisin family serine protease